jgi:hypothetical protein
VRDVAANGGPRDAGNFPAGKRTHGLSLCIVRFARACAMHHSVGLGPIPAVRAPAAMLASTAVVCVFGTALVIGQPTKASSGST